MRVPRHTHLSAIRSARATFKHASPFMVEAPVEEVLPLVAEVPVAADVHSVAVEPVAVEPVAVEPVAVVEEAPVVVEVPVAPVKRTRKRKSDVVEAPVAAPVEEPVAEVSPEA